SPPSFAASLHLWVGSSLPALLARLPDSHRRTREDRTEHSLHFRGQSSVRGRHHGPFRLGGPFQMGQQEKKLSHSVYRLEHVLERIHPRGARQSPERPGNDGTLQALAATGRAVAVVSRGASLAHG